MEGGRVTIEGSGLPVEPVLPRVTIGGAPARLTARVVHVELTAVVPGRARRRPHPDPHRRGGWRDGVRRNRRSARHRAASGRQPGLRRRGQRLRHVQRFARAAGPGRDLHRPSGWLARAVRVGSCQSDVARVQSATGRLHVSSRFDGSVHKVDSRGKRHDGRYRSRRRVRHCVLRRRHVVSSAIDRDRFFASVTAARRCLPVFRRAWRPFILRSVLTDGSTSPRRRWPRAIRSIEFHPKETCTSFTTALADRKGSRSTSTGICMSSMRWLVRVALYRLHLDRPTEAEQMVSGGSLIGLAFYPTGGFVLASSDTVYRFGRSPAARRPA